MTASSVLAAADRNRKPSIIDEDHLGRMTLGDRRLERASGHAMALGEGGMCALSSTVGDLNRAKQRLFDAVGVAFVQLLVGLAQRRKRRRQLLGRLGDRVQYLLSGVGCCV